MDIEDMKTREALLQKARYSADEQIDDVKRMNQMVLYAKCVTIRDKQVKQTADIKKENENQERLLDMMMESDLSSCISTWSHSVFRYERQKNVQNQKSMERKASAERKEGRIRCWDGVERLNRV